ncbi:PAS domain S-box protein [Maribacter sp. BPC-D8]|uniref:PAS domain-containing sensor histidine kinase n=1 Tax=Maribacter sp. BPC-D8 TaxID=3053613 RepID=UPI002B485205|nr:PAS domain S-box protein [Maribacter sp. BPC-D8]WRI28458.1 PAS domain S-box protein [Maribacter sp. BPC-D8]
MSQYPKNTELLEKHHQIFIEQTPTAIAMLDTNMVYLAVSKRWIKDFVFEDEDIVGRSHYDIFPEIGDDWKTKNQECLNGAIDICDEAPFTRADGSIQWIYWDVRPWYNSSGEVGGLLMHTGDITEQKEKELEKKRVESILNDTSEIARISTWEINLSTQELLWSKMAYKIYEVTDDYRPTVDGALEFFKYDEDKQAAKIAIQNAIDYGSAVDMDVEMLTAKGNTIWAKILGKVESISGVPTRFYGILQDVSSIKLTEQSLNKAHSELEAIFNSKSTAIITTDKNGIINRFNSGAEKLLGYTAAEMIGLKKPEVYLLSEELEQFKQDMIKEFGKNAADINFNYRNENVNDTRQWTYKRKNGTTFPVLSTLTAVNNKKGENEGFIAVATDISKIKEVKDELRRKNDLLTLAEHISLMGHWQWNSVLDKVQWSQNLYTIFELEENVVDLKFDTYFSFVHPQDKDLVTEYFDKSAKDGTFYSFSHKIIAGNGVIKTIHLVGKVTTNEKGDMVEMFGTCQDVTEIRMVERNLQKANSELQAIFNSDSILIVTTDKDGIINRFNHGAESLLGYSAAEMVGIEKPRKYVDNDEIVKFRNDIAVLRGKDPSTYDYYKNISEDGLNDTREWTYYKKDGTPVSVLSTLTTIKNSDKDNEGYIAISKDISEIKAAENELLKKNQLLNFAEQISMMSNWKWDTVADKVEWSQNFYKILELDEAIIELNFNSYYRFVHPEDIEIVNNHFEKVEKDKKWERFTHRIITTSGKVKTILLLGKVFTNEKDEIVEMIGTCQDVTESKKAEQRLIDAKEELEVVAEKLSYQNKQLADFTHITSHNLRAPVANLNSLMEIYKLTDDDEERLDIFSKFDTVIDRLTLTLNTLIEALKTKISDTQEELESVDLNDIFEDTTQTLSGSILTSRAVIKGDFTEVPTITYNRIYMDSIFLNLIGNAIKYRAKDRTPEIIVKSRVKNGRNIITFKDNGLGIDLERHGHKLFGLNKVFHRHPDAKGVGLFLTKTQVEAMGGTITATSEVNVGTTFTIIF